MACDESYTGAGRGPNGPLALPAIARDRSVERERLQRDLVRAPVELRSLDAAVTGDRGQCEWTVRAPAGSRVGLVARHDRAGRVRTEVVLG